MPFALLLGGLALPAAAEAQERCTPQSTDWCYQVGPDGSVHLQSPKVRVDPNVHVDPNIHVNPPPAAIDPNVQIELKRQLAWQAYLDARVRIDAQVEVAVRARIDAEAKAYAGAAPNPFPLHPSWGPGGGAHAEEPITFPRIDFGPFAFCAEVFTGRGSPYAYGFCPPVRYRFTETWAIAVDPSFLWQRHGTRDFHTVGASPALLASFGFGHGGHNGSYAFGRAGLDAWVPVDGGADTSDAFLGAHAGVGVHVQIGSLLGVGAETRGLVRAGTSEAADGMSRARFGFEARFYFFSFSW